MAPSGIQILHALHTSFALLQVQMYWSLLTALSLHAKSSALHKTLPTVKDPASLHYSCAGPSAYGPIFTVCGTPAWSILGVPWWAEEPKRRPAKQQQSKGCSCRQSCSGQLQIPVEPHAVYWHGQTHVSKHYCCYKNVGKSPCHETCATESQAGLVYGPGLIYLGVTKQSVGSAGLIASNALFRAWKLCCFHRLGVSVSTVHRP